jgi:hypothetical protein
MAAGSITTDDWPEAEAEIAIALTAAKRIPNEEK